MSPADETGSPATRPVAAITMSRFPKLTETFVLNELLALPEHGIDVEVFPLLREKAPVVHASAAAVTEAATFYPFMSVAILRSNLRTLRAKPAVYLGSLLTLIRETWRSPNFLVGALGIFPKVVAAAERMHHLGVDHMHCHFATHPAVAGWIVHRLVGIPYSFTAHGSDLHVDRRMLPLKVREAAFVVAISDDNRDEILQDCGVMLAERVHVIRCGVDSHTFAPRPFRSIPAKLNLVSIGTLHEVKGQRHLLDACQLLHAAGALSMCTFIGDGPDHDLLVRHAKSLGLDEVVTFAGPCPSRVVASHLGQADVLIAPSVPTAAGKREGIPVVLMEAMASGVPVIASRLSGIPELVEHDRSGLLTPPGDHRAIAAAVLRLRDEAGLAERLVAGGLEMVQGEFDLSRNVERLANLIRQSAAGAR